MLFYHGIRSKHGFKSIHYLLHAGDRRQIFFNHTDQIIKLFSGGFSFAGDINYFIFFLRVLVILDEITFLLMLVPVFGEDQAYSSFWTHKFLDILGGQGVALACFIISDGAVRHTQGHETVIILALRNIRFTPGADSLYIRYFGAGKPVNHICIVDAAVYERRYFTKHG